MRSIRCFSLLPLWTAMLVSFSDGLGNCTSAPVVTMPRENTHFEIRGLFVRVVPARNFEPVYGVGEISWEPIMVVERNKSLALVNGVPFPSGQAVCQIPTGVDIFSPSYNPAYESAPGEACPGSDLSFLGIPRVGTPCGSLLQTWQPEDFDCYTERYNHTIQGVQVETVAVHSWLAGRPGTFAFKAYYQLAEKDFSYTVPRYLFADSTVSFTKGSMKMSYTLSNVPWLYNNSAPGIVYENDRDSASFLSLFYKMSVNSSVPGNLSSESHGNYSVTKFTSDDHTVELTLKLDLVTVLDNITATSPAPGGGYGNDSLKVHLHLDANVGFSGISVILFCPLNQGHWALMEYDPSISALFSPGPEEPGSKTPGKSKSRLSQGAIAGISVGAILVVLILVAVFALLSTRTDAFKRFVRPFTARKQAAKAKNLSPKDDPHQPLQASTPTETKWASPTKSAPI